MGWGEQGSKHVNPKVIEEGSGARVQHGCADVVQPSMVAKGASHNI